MTRREAGLQPTAEAGDPGAGPTGALQPAVESDTYPADLRERAQWLTWKATDDGRKVRRAPYDHRDQVDGFVSAQDPAVWTSFDVAAPLAADVATIPGQPVSFVEPTPGSTLASRRAETEQQPLAFLLATEDFDAAAEQFALTDAGEWADRRVAWFDADPFRRALGVLEAP